MNKGLVPRGTQKEEPRREVVGKTFNLAKMESAHSGKMTKWKAAKKLNLKRWGVEALKEERLEVSSLRTPQNGKSARGFLGKKHQKKKTMRNKEGTSHWSC